MNYHIEITYNPLYRAIEYCINIDTKSEFAQNLLAKLNAFPMCVCIHYEQRLLVLREYKVAIYTADLDELAPACVVAASPLQLNSKIHLEVSSLSEHVIQVLLQELNRLFHAWLDEEVVNMQISNHNILIDSMKDGVKLEW